jgi:hypothetical protein
MVEALVSYEIRDDGLHLRHANPSAGYFGSALRIAPDGGNLSYVSFRLREFSLPGSKPSTKKNDVGAFSAEDVRVVNTSYEQRGRATDLAYHPFLDLVAVYNRDTSEISFFGRKTGDEVGDRIDSRDPDKPWPHRIYFTPGGRHLLVEGEQQGAKKWVVRALPLYLTDAEMKVVASRTKDPGGTTTGPQKPPGAPPFTQAPSTQPAPPPGTPGQATPASRTPEQICKSWLNMAENFRRSGLPDKAREYLQKIIDTYPDTEQAKEAREILKGM